MRKEQIITILENIYVNGSGKNLIDSGSLKNIVIFENEVVLDIQIDNPSLQAKRKLKSSIKEAIIEMFPKAIVQSNIILREVENTPKEKKLANIKNIIAVASGKGGVGKSTITSNVAISLQKMGFNVGILDADIYGPSIHLMFDVDNEKPLAIRVNGKSKMKPIVSYGVKIISIGFFTEPDKAVIWRGPMASKALNQMIFDAHWGDLDFLLIDLPPGTGDIHLSIVQSLPITGAVIVSTPQNIALADAKKGFAMFRQENINVQVLGIVENMSYFIPKELPESKYYIFGKNGAFNLAQDLKTTFLGGVPLVEAICQSGDVGHPVALQKDTLVENAFREVTRNMVSQMLKRNEDLPPTEVVRITNMSGCKNK